MSSIESKIFYGRTYIFLTSSFSPPYPASTVQTIYWGSVNIRWTQGLILTRGTWVWRPFLSELCSVSSHSFERGICANGPGLNFIVNCLKRTQVCFVRDDQIQPLPLQGDCDVKKINMNYFEQRGIFLGEGG